MASFSSVFIIRGQGNQPLPPSPLHVPIVAGPGVTRVVRLSDYGPGLKGTLADTWVYFLEGKEPGGKVAPDVQHPSNEPED